MRECVEGYTKNIAVLPPNAYESISNFMFKDTFEQIESVFDTPELFYEIPKSIRRHSKQGD